ATTVSSILYVAYHGARERCTLPALRRVLIFAGIALSLVNVAIASASAGRREDTDERQARSAFALLMARITVGMSPNEVLSILDRPSDIALHEEPGVISIDDT